MTGAVTIIAQRLPALEEIELACFAIGARDAVHLAAGLRLLLAGIIETETDAGTSEHEAAVAVLSAPCAVPARVPVAPGIERIMTP